MLDLDDSEAPVTTTERRIIYDAHRYMMLAYNLNDPAETQHTIRIRTTAEIPDDSRVGMWNGVEIVLYMNVIHSLDLLFLITVHEYLHDLAFSYVDVGHGSFQDRTNDTTLQHRGPHVDECFTQCRSCRNGCLHSLLPVALETRHKTICQRRDGTGAAVVKH